MSQVIQAKHRIDRFLKLMKDRGASDMHLSVGRPPILRKSGRIDSSICLCAGSTWGARRLLSSIRTALYGHGLRLLGRPG